MKYHLLLPSFIRSLHACSQCDMDICGYWYSEYYNGGVPVEYVAVDMVDGAWVCTKILGDPYVPTGHVTWQGVPSSCQFQGEIFATNGIGNPIVPLTATISILSENEIRVSPFGLIFYRSTVEHLDFIGVDHRPFPVSCISCTSSFPNVFTPNGDGVNDVLEQICGGLSHRFAVSDRWGLTMYETTVPQPIWDGRNGWIPCPEGTYNWSMITADDRTGMVKRGVVHLLR